MEAERTKEAWYQEGNALRGQGRYEEAIASYEQALRLDPNYANAHMYKGLTLRKLGNVEGALSAYDEALRSDPTSADARELLGHK